MGISEILRSFKGPTLDPGRTAAARYTFDCTGKYSAWQQNCQNLGAIDHVVSRPTSALAKDGFEVLTLLTAEEAANTKSLALSSVKTMGAAKNDIDYADVLRFDDTSFFLPVVEKMLAPDVVARISEIYRSEFYVHSLTVNRTMPSKVSKRSFLWHCDRGPMNFLKINMFLDATAEHGGTTEFIELAQSEAFERSGYTFGSNKDRVSDLTRLGSKLGVTPKVIRPDLAAGQAFIFFPSRVLHRGFLPSRGVRHMLSLVLLPSPIPWRDAWKATVKSGFHERSMATFPDTAEQLFQELELPRQAL